MPFTTEYVAGNDEGVTWASDEYGRHPRRLTANDEKRREEEWATHLSAKKEWAKKRIEKPFAHVSEKDEERVGNKMVEDYLRKEGLLPPEATRG